MIEPKQVIVVNRSLNMPPGKLAAQVAHASMGALLMVKNNIGSSGILLPFIPTSAPEIWLNNKFTKIVVYVKSEEKLLNVYEKAKANNMLCALICDDGRTFFDKPTYTCVGIGPAWPDEFIGITDKLRLLE